MNPLIKSSIQKKSFFSNRNAKAKGLEIINELGKVLKKWLEAQIIAFFFITVFTTWLNIKLKMFKIKTLFNSKSLRTESWKEFKELAFITSESVLH